ncbi:aspartate aminotransferase family protein [Niallia sp. XMNu-256]|uniref:aspartate aminotransferase family protein n=1 Tax=Niallia sp. XMNu-256 TaxID=3082444 RepID=UPI0030D319E7
MKNSYLIKPLLSEHYPTVQYGKGVYLYDVNGKSYLDASSGAVTANIGHGVVEVIEAMKKQANDVSFVYRSQFTNVPAESLAQKVAELAPDDLNWSFFVNSGSEATETAMKIAIQHWQEKGMNKKTKVLSRWVSYHGITLGALSMSGHSSRRERLIPLLHDFPTIHPPYCYRCPYNKTVESCGYACAHELEMAIKRIGADQIAAFIAEPIIGAAGGAITPPPYYYKIIQEICERHNILFIADEVMTGFGRTGTWFAFEQWNIVPDIVALGKGMGAGYTAIAATLVSDRVMDPILKGSKLVMSGHTLSANPQSCATSLAVLNYLEQNNIIPTVFRKGQLLLSALQKLQSQYSFIGDIRGRGLLIGVEFVQDRQTKEPFPRKTAFTQMFIKKALTNGLLLYPAGSGLDGIHGDAIILSPPLTITEQEINDLINRLSRTCKEMKLELDKRGNMT